MRASIPCGIQACHLDIRTSVLPGCAMPILGSLPLMEELDIVVHSRSRLVDICALNVFSATSVEQQNL